ASVVAAEIGGVRQYLQMTDKGVVGVAADDGLLLWRYLRKPAYSDIVIPTCIVRGDLVYTTAGYGAGCDLVRITPPISPLRRGGEAESPSPRGGGEGGEHFKATRVYANKNMVNQHGGTVLVGDHVYGYSDGKGWICQDFLKGNIVWSEK